MTDKDPNETPPVKPDEAKPEGVKTIEEVSTLLKTSQENATSLKQTVEEQGGRIESLQDSLETALEEIAQRGGTPPAEPELKPEVPPVKPKPEVEVKPEVPPAPKPKPETPEDTRVIETELEKAIDEDRAFREEISTRFAIDDLKEELASVKVKFPEANEKEILLGIEDGVFENEPNQIEALAKSSHDKNLKQSEDLKTKVEEDLRAKLKKEAEGDISLPQSQGTSKPSKTPKKPGEFSEPTSPEADWNVALEKAKAEGGTEE